MEVLPSLVRKYGVDLKEHFPLNKISRVGTKGVAKFYFRIRTETDLLKVTSEFKKEGILYHIAGYNFNTLWGDGFFEGAVVDMRFLKHMIVKNGVLIVSAGCSLSSLVKFSVDSGISGFEEFSGIPGSVGASVVNNSGAFGKSMGDIVEWVKVWDPETEALDIIKNKEITFSYRNSSLKGLVVLEVAFSYTISEREKVLSMVKSVLVERKRKFPGGRSLGCVFKNPEGNFAGKILEDLGFKGLSLGKVRVSEKHANFIIAEDEAVASDYLSLINKIKNEVFLKRGIHLEEEINYAGTFI